MQGKGAPRYWVPLLVAAVLLAAAAAVFPFDDAIAASVRAFSHAAGKEHGIQELLVFIRPFGKGEVALLLAVALGWCGARRRAAHILLSLLIVSLLVWPFKWGVARARPNQANTESFPSGDAATVAAFCAPLAAATPWSIPFSAAATASVAAARVYDGKHFPSDVLAGAAFGVLAGVVAGALLRRRHYRPRRVWFLVIGVAVVLIDVAKLPWSRALPYALAFLGAWGPAAVLLVVARMAPPLHRLWRRQHRLPRTERANLFLLATAVFLLYLLLTTASTLWDRDEPRFSRATVEMVASGNYLYPTFNGDLRPDKPILIYWLMSIPVRLFGASELTCRMVAPLATIAAGLLLFWVANRMAGPRAGRLAFACMALSPLMAVSGTAATTDALLLACITGAVCAFLLSWTRGLAPLHIALLTLALAGALLTKGPVALIPVASILGMLCFVRGGAVTSKAYLPWLLLAVVVAGGLFLAWALPANAATGGEFYRRGLGHHVVDRAVRPLESHGGKSLLFCLYYLPVIFLAFFPWTLYLPRVFAGSPPPSAAVALPIRPIVLCWTLPVLVLMSVVATKLPHYILPAWPALALASALGVLRAAREGKAGNRAAAARIGFGLFLCAGLTLGAALIVAPWFAPLRGVRVPMAGMGMLFLVMTAGGAHWYRRGRHEAAAGVLAGGVAMILLVAGLFLLPAMERYKLSPRIASAITRHVPPGTPVTTCGYGEPSLNFYLGWGPIQSIEEAQVNAWSTAPGRGVLVVKETKLGPATVDLTRPNIRALAKVHGFNYSQGKWITVVVMEKAKRTQTDQRTDGAAAVPP